MTTDELNVIKAEVFKEADSRYVKIAKCDEIHASVDEKLHNDDKRIDLVLQGQQHIQESLTKNNWLTMAILSVIIASVIGFFLFGRL